MMGPKRREVQQDRDLILHHSASRSAKAGHSERQWARSPKGALQSTHESEEPRWRAARTPGKVSWPHQHRPQNQACEGKDEHQQKSSARTTVHRLRAQVDVEDTEGRHGCAQSVTKRLVKGRGDTRPTP